MLKDKPCAQVSLGDKYAMIIKGQPSNELSLRRQDSLLTIERRRSSVNIPSAELLFSDGKDNSVQLSSGDVEEELDLELLLSRR